MQTHRQQGDIRSLKTKIEKGEGNGELDRHRQTKTDIQRDSKVIS
jgi:hypothetical protein